MRAPRCAPSRAEVIGDFAPGTKPVAGYTLTTRLGRGGFGEVWRAAGPGGLEVALKFVRLDRPAGRAERQALEVMRGVRHPHLLAVVGTWELPGHLAVAMELADRTLEDRLREAHVEGHSGIPREELLSYLAEAAQAIDYLNESRDGKPRIQHGDVKPQNLLLSGGSVKVADFGLATALRYNVGEHTAGMTPAYAAPERFAGNMSRSSDLYSLAVTYCYLRCGRLPFEDAAGRPPKVSSADWRSEPDLSLLTPAERPAVARALARLPKDRWGSCSEFAQALQSAAAQSDAEADGSAATEKSAAADAGLASRSARPPGAAGVWGRWLAAAAIVAILALVVAVVSWKGGPADPEQTAPQVAAAAAGGGLPARQQAEGGLERTAADARRPVTLAVMDFENHSQDPALDPFRLGFRDMLVTDLVRVSAVKVLERSRLKALLEEHELAKTPFIDGRTAVRLGKGLSAHAMLTGSYVIAGEDVRVDVRLVSVETGEVLLADAVTGKASDIFALQRALSRKVLQGLGVKPTEAEDAALGTAQTRSFAAFRLYSEARLAVLRGEREEAQRRLRQALAEDPHFERAAEELSRLEDEVLLRISKERQRQAAAAGRIGQTLQEHWAKHRDIVQAGRRNPAYFASLVVLAAHAGLSGDADQERQLLTSYWERFARSIPPEEALPVAGQINAILVREGKFFQELVDSGDYALKIPDFGRGFELNLKPELRGVYHWPRYSAMWPFDEDLRSDFSVMAESKDGRKLLGPEWFEERMPRFPHDYVAHLIEGEDDVDRRDTERAAAGLRLVLSVAAYYSRLPERPKGLAESVDRLHDRLLSRLERSGPAGWPNDVLREAIPVLERLAKSDADAARRERANQFLLTFLRQLRIDEGQPAPKSGNAAPTTFCALTLRGPRIVFCLDMGDMGDLALKPFAQEQLADAVRGLRPPAEFEIRLFGEVDPRNSAIFGELRSASPETQRTALALVDGVESRRDFLGGATTRLSSVLEAVVARWPKAKPAGVDGAGAAGGHVGGDVCIVCFEEPDLSGAQVEKLLEQLPPGVRVHLVVTEKSPVLARLAKATGGGAVLLREGDLFDVTVSRWDVGEQ